MIRALFAMTGIFATLILLVEMTVVGILWSRGMLSSQSIRDIRLALSGQASTALPVDEIEEQPPTATLPSEAEIQESRITRVLEIQARETELTLLKRMTTESANRLISDRQAFDQLRQEFRDELSVAREQTMSAATEQTRTILIASPPEAAAARLMGLTAQEGVELLRGLPEKTTSRILQAFAADPDLAARGQELFEGIYRGDPQRSIIERAARQLDGVPTPPETPAG